MTDKPVFILNGIGFNSNTAFEIAGIPVSMITARRILRCFDDVAVLVEDGVQLQLPENVNLLSLPKKDVYTAFSKILEVYPDREVYLFGDLYAPFLEPELGQKYAAITLERLAHFTYGEHYPLGVAPCALAHDTVKILCNVASGNYTPMDDEAFMDLMGLDINSYDIEVDVSEDDFRRYRLDLRVRDIEKRFLISRLVDALGGEALTSNYKELSKVLLEHQELHRSLPAYVELDLSDNCSLTCDFCPRQAMGLSGIQNGNGMDIALALSIVDQLAELNPDAGLCLSPFSEPLESSIWQQVADRALSAGLHLFMETNGLGMDENFRKWFIGQDSEKLTVIVSLDMLSAEEYEKYKGVDKYDEAVGNTRALLMAGARNCYLQILNMDELSNVIDDFYDFWSECEDRVLPRKYNNYCGKLADRSSTDLSPLIRFACWHLKRDMVIRCDGKVLLCKQDINAEGFDGDLAKETLKEVWDRLGDKFSQHISGDDWGLPLCKNCDEWHTYNF